MKKNPFFWVVAIAGLILDQVTKYAISQTFNQVGETVPLWAGIFHLTYVKNTGAAFSFFTGGVSWLRWLSLAVSLGLIVLARLTRLGKLEQLGYGCVLAGAFGNGIDRFLFGYVIDFFDFRLINFPVFNIADVCINLGIIFLLAANFTFTTPSNKR
jgi:signal peptidase II